MDMLEYAHCLEKCDIINVYNKESLLHRIIAFVTRKESKFKAGHTLIYLYDDLVAEATWKGIRINPLKTYKKYKHIVYISRYKEGLTKEQISSITKDALILAGIRYSYIQLIGLAFKYIFKLKRIGDLSRKAMICSEYTCRTYKYSSIYLFPGKSCAEIVPGHYPVAETLNTLIIS